ncbi:MAG: TonB-dependent receptor [Betaproteobacteria bacterium]|nr:TonB-dependent receptor [Betaproteobacteria bacterium]
MTASKQSTSSKSFLRDGVRLRSGTRSLLVGCSCLGICLAQAYAQSENDRGVTLPPVVVSATTYPQPLSSSLPSVSVITREQISESGARNIITLLQRIAGVQLTFNGGPGHTSTTYVRGFGSTDLGVLVLLNGVPLAPQDASGSAGYLENLTTDQIQRIEVIRGNVSAIYGAGAIGGAVLITTRDGSKKPQGSVSVMAGSRDTGTFSANASGQVGKTAVQAGISRYSTQGIPSINPAQSSYVGSTAADGYRNTTMNASIVQELVPGQSLGLRAFRSDGQYTYDNAVDAGENKQELEQLFSDNKLASNWTSHLSLSQQTTNNLNFGSYPSTSRTRIQQMLWRNAVQLGSGWTATGGLDLQHQSIDTTGGGSFPSKSRNADAVFVGLNGAFAGNAIQLDLRRDSFDGYSGQNTGYLGYGRELGGGFKAIASYSTAFNVPPLGYLYYSAQPYWEANANLKPEKAHSAEGGLQWARGSTVLRATLFQTTTSDQWSYGTDPATGATQFQNIARARTRGLELTGSGTWNDWAYDANLTLQQPVDLTQPGMPTLPRHARSMANVAINHAFGNTLIGTQVHYSGPRPDAAYDANFNQIPVTLGSYTTVDLTASGVITPQWSWNARLQNLFDKKYQTAYSYNREPFGVFVGLTWHPLGS